MALTPAERVRVPEVEDMICILRMWNKFLKKGGSRCSAEVPIPPNNIPLMAQAIFLTYDFNERPFAHLKHQIRLPFRLYYELGS